MRNATFDVSLFLFLVFFSALTEASTIVDRVRNLEGFFAEGIFEVKCTGKNHYGPSGIFSVRKELFGSIDIRLKQGVNWIPIEPLTFSDAGLTFRLYKDLRKGYLSLRNSAPTDSTVADLIQSRGNSYQFQWGLFDSKTKSYPRQHQIGMEFQLDFIEQELRSKGIHYKHPTQKEPVAAFVFGKLKEDVKTDLKEFKLLHAEVSSVLAQLRNDMPEELGRVKTKKGAVWRSAELKGFANDLFMVGAKVLSTSVGRDLKKESLYSEYDGLPLGNWGVWPNAVSRQMVRAFEKPKNSGIPEFWQDLPNHILQYHINHLFKKKQSEALKPFETQQRLILQHWIDDLDSTVEEYAALVLEAFAKYSASLPEDDVLFSELALTMPDLTGIGIYATTGQTSECRLL